MISAKKKPAPEVNSAGETEVGVISRAEISLTRDLDDIKTAECLSPDMDN